jgi:hypothetical protein
MRSDPRPRNSGESVSLPLLYLPGRDRRRIGSQAVARTRILITGLLRGPAAIDCLPTSCRHLSPTKERSYDSSQGNFRRMRMKEVETATKRSLYAMLEMERSELIRRCPVSAGTETTKIR